MSDIIRVRFAPSPTGLMHIGNLRAALFNFLFARHGKGTFILRIEDTDKTRYVPESLPNILEALDWYGLNVDEGPFMDSNGKVAERGDSGPYTQSKRLPIYRRYANELVEKKVAYPCFCTPERLEQVRHEQSKRKEAPRYDKRCRVMDLVERERNIKSGIPMVIRLAMPTSGITEFNDLIRGTVKFENSSIDDQVLLKSDGYPTYHLANVVDDHLMRISHVIRAEEWLPSTPKHLVLFKAFGWNPPHYAHLPMILGNDRTKLSKRHGAVPALNYRDLGFLPQAVVNYIALLGWNPGGERESYSVSELVDLFSLNKVNKAPSIFDLQKLIWMNGIHIRSMSPEQLVPYVRWFLSKLPSDEYDVDDATVAKVLTVIQDRIPTLADIAQWGSFYFKRKISYTKGELANLGKEPVRSSSPTDSTKKTEEALKFALNVLEGVSNLTFTPLELRENFMKMMQAEGKVNKDVLPFLRYTISGSTVSADVFDMMACLGKERTLKRVEEALMILRT